MHRRQRVQLEVEVLGKLAAERGLLALHRQRHERGLDTLGPDLDARVRKVGAGVPRDVVELDHRRVPVGLVAHGADGEGHCCDRVERLHRSERLAEAAGRLGRDRRLREQLGDRVAPAVVHHAQIKVHKELVLLRRGVYVLADRVVADREPELDELVRELRARR
eukprot:3183380-Rhodomonas_salina.1